MSHVYVVAAVPAATRAAAEAAVAPYLTGPNAEGVHSFSAPLVPLAGADDAAPTHFGCCAPVTKGGELYSLIPALAAGIPGTVYSIIDPVRSFEHATHWVGFLASHSLKPQVLPLTTNP